MRMKLTQEAAMLAFITVFLLLAPNGEASYPRPDLLIEPAALSRKNRAQVLDVRAREKYQESHIPGALWVDLTDWNKAFATGQEVKDWEKRLGGLGIQPDRPVVIYGDDWREAARVWWILRYWGIQDAKVLNGGWQGWQAADMPVEKGEVQAKASKIKLIARSDRLADRNFVLDVVKDRSTQIVDTRSVGEHCGDVKTAKRSGAIPGAKHLEWSQVIDSKTQRFKSADDLTKLMREAGIDPKKPAVTYCQSGGRAAVMAFALELMGGKKVRNYYRSWSEWGNDPDTPIVKPEKK